jgi:hypothetical protein
VAKRHFDALEADPAYKTAVDDAVTPDRFVQKYVVGDTRDNLAKLRANIGNDSTTNQTLGVAVFHYLRDQSPAGLAPPPRRLSARDVRRATRSLR